jgi:hypothetical protein
MVISMPHFLALPALLEHPDLTAIVPRPLAPSLAGFRKLSIYELPYKPSVVDVSILWHERTAKEPAHRWLRELLGRAAESLRNSSREIKDTAQCVPAAARAASQPIRTGARVVSGFHRVSNMATSVP